MSDCADFLVEIGTEELPPKSLNGLIGAFAAEMLTALDKNHLSIKPDQIHPYSAPRRLALLISDLPLSQPDREEQRLGPAVSAAFKPDGQATPAANGFARSCGVEIDDLEKLETDKGIRLAYTRKISGDKAENLLLGMIEHALSQLPIPKPMRWGDSSFAFVRPVHWVLMRLGEQTLSGELLGCQIDRFSYGHRFHSPGKIEIDHPQDYEQKLRRAFVLANFEQRKAVIKEQCDLCAAKVNGKAVIRDAVLDEVANLVEWPVSVTGSFEQEFLKVPAEALISSMEGHQKFFPIVDQQGNLLPHFIAFANISSKDQDAVRIGLERVIRPRLADARFFWDRDRKNRLEQQQSKLENMVYQKKLGSLWEKTLRVQSLAVKISETLNLDATAVKRAALLAKCDLLTDMVGEFPDLQGTMGRYYAQAQGEPEEVAVAIQEQYLPRFAGDQLPASDAGQILALAERLDSLCGIFSAGLKPSGNRDPFGLRRAALGLIRLMIEQNLDLDLFECLKLALAQITSIIPDAQNNHPQVLEFVMERLRAYYLDQGVSNDVFEAVWAVKPTRLNDFARRIDACRAFRSEPEAAALAAANKRIGNILKKSETTVSKTIDTGLFTEAAEIALNEALNQAKNECKPLIENKNYQETLARLAQLRPQVDGFFDDVMVMAEDTKVRDNRLALLSSLKASFDDVADVARLLIGQ